MKNVWIKILNAFKEDTIKLICVLRLKNKSCIKNYSKYSTVMYYLYYEYNSS